MLPTPTDIREAADRLRGVIEATPLTRSAELSTLAGLDVFLKEEQRQRTGSFKLRGAYNVLATLPREVQARGVVASSAGNHGLGVAYAARLLGIRATLFVPSTAPRVKRDGIAALGGEVDESSPDYDAAHEAAEQCARAEGRTFVNPCAGTALLAGQGTVALEILSALPDIATMVIPVGGGGLVGGIAALVRAEAPGVRIVGVQSDRTNAMARSMAAGRRVYVPVLPTLADGLAGQIDDEGYAIGQFALDDMITVSEDDIASTISWLARVHGIRAEGSGVVGVAAVRGARIRDLRGPVAVVVSGGNIDPALWQGIVEGER